MRRKNIKPKHIILLIIMLILLVLVIFSYTLKPDRELNKFEQIVKDVVTSCEKIVFYPFKLVINKDYIVTILDENENVVAFGFALPELCYAVKKSKGKLFPFGLFRILHATRHGDTADFGLVGVRKAYQGKGLTAIILDYIINMAKNFGIKHIETNHSLETNAKILQTWKNFDDVTNHKRYRCFIKKLDNKNVSTDTQIESVEKVDKKPKSTKKTTKTKEKKSTKKAHK